MEVLQFLNRKYVEGSQVEGVTMRDVYRDMVKKYSYRLLSQYSYFTGQALRSQRVAPTPDETDVG